MDINVLFVDNEEEKQMREDRLEIDEFLYRVNSYFFTQNINFKLISFNRDRPVEHYREVINESTVVLFTCYNEFEPAVKRMFEITNEEFKKTENPSFVPLFYFRKTQNAKFGVKSFKDLLVENNLFYSNYDDAAIMKLILLFVIKDHRLNDMKIEFEDDEIKIDLKDSSIKPFNIPFVANYKNLKNLIFERDKMASKVRALGGRFLLDTNNKDAELDFKNQTLEKEKITQDILQYEFEVLAIIESLVKVLYGSPKHIAALQKALDYLDDGDFEGFNSIINCDEIIKMYIKEKNKNKKKKKK